MSSKKKIILSINTVWNVVNFRTSLIKFLQKKNFEVIVLAQSDDYFQELAMLDIRFISIPINSQKISVFNDIDKSDTCIEKLFKVAKAITELPPKKKFLRKIERLIDDRKKMFFEKDSLDWAMGEMLAYGSLLLEGHDIRISGQDVERGTFSHRHAIVKAEDSEEDVILLNKITDNQGKFRIYNSSLSEYGVLGFDYGTVVVNVTNALDFFVSQQSIDYGTIVSPGSIGSDFGAIV